MKLSNIFQENDIGLEVGFPSDRLEILKSFEDYMVVRIAGKLGTAKCPVIW
jgi:hypothetical protein